MDNKEIRKAVDPLEGVVRKTMQQEGGLLELKQPECEPLELDCSSDLVPAHSGHKATVMADGNTMTRYLFDHYRLAMYSYLNRALRDGTLSGMVGFKILEKVINRNVCQFPMGGVSFWKIDRKNIYADVKVELKLHSNAGIRIWQGVLVCIISFETGVRFSVEEVADSVDHVNDGCVRLSPFLIAYHTSKMMDSIGETILRKYMPEALTDPSKRDPVELAHRMGLNVIYEEVYNHRGVGSILFFAEGDLVAGEDRRDRLSGEYRKTKSPRMITVPANTIVVNTNLLNERTGAFAVAHECVHFYEHYLFFRLQELGNSDPRNIKTREVIVEEGHELHDPIHFMEKQADRGAYALIMPATHTEQLIRQECARVTKYRNVGEQYETAGLRIAEMLQMPHFRIRARMIQLGHYEAKGALNYVRDHMIQPFAFARDSLAVEVLTFVIWPGALQILADKNEKLKKLLDSGRYVYADGHAVRNDPRFVERHGVDLVLTDWARAHVDECCLRFIRVYVQQMVGKYVFGRMYYDSDYVARTQEFIEDIMRAEQMDEIDAKIEYKARFPRSFVKAFDQVMKANGYTRERIADELGIHVNTLSNRLNGKTQISLDFIVRACLLWRLPDWISCMLLERAGIKLSEYDRRHQAIEHILHILWSEGIEKADRYLTSCGLETLKS